MLGGFDGSGEIFDKLAAHLALRGEMMGEVSLMLSAGRELHRQNLAKRVLGGAE